MKNKYQLRPTARRLAPIFTAWQGFLRLGSLLGLMLGLALGAAAQQGAPQFFEADAEARGAAAASPLAATLVHSMALTLDVNGLRAALATAPLETRANAVPLVLALPLPNGRTGRFAVRETLVMAPELAARFPMIKTYAGVGLDDAAASVRLDLTPQGFHAQVLTSDNRSFYIDPATRTDTRHYLGFYRKDMNRAAAGLAMTCAFAPTKAELKASKDRTVAALARSASALASGAQLRTYRLALANTPEYALTKGNTAAGVMAGEVTSVNRVVGVYEKELAVRMVLVPNNNLLLFLSGTGPQPSPAYSNSNSNALLVENQSNIDRIIGSANYDIGHVFTTGGGGQAGGVGVVCIAGSKAQGETGLPNPVGDAYDIDFVAHEMGHQFGGSHTFNSNVSLCGGQREPSKAFEPGSGSTIMAYAGTCGSSDLQPNSDPIFHTGSYEEMQAFINATPCKVTTATGNTAPVVTAPASGKTLPIGTPFKLTATATDAENDPLTYLWEEVDLGPPAGPNDVQAPNQTVPLFRSFTPSASSTRYFPRLSDLVNNTTVIGERLPTVTRALNFRCTARDEHSGPVGVIGGVNYSPTVSLGVTSTAGPFVVQSPNTNVSWIGGAAQTVTWNVAGTAAAPVSCAVVNIRLSLDGGLTYPTLLAQNVPNNGSAVVVAPSPASAQTQARVMVEAADNYFFDISNADFAITPPAVGPTITSFSPGGGPIGTVVTILGSNFTGAVSVVFNGTPATFTVNSATQITATVAAGTTTGQVVITTPQGTAMSAVPFVVGVAPIITSFTPTSGAANSTVVITGTGFTAATQVTFNGVVAPTYTVNSPTRITVTVPIGATTGPISVTTPIASATSTGIYTVIPSPIITSFTPAAGSVGVVVVLTGSNFTGATQVAFNGTAAPTFTVNSGNEIFVTVPAGATTGLISVTTTAGGTGFSTTNFTVPTVPNDLCADAIAISCGQTVMGTTVGSTSFGDPTADCAGESVDAGAGGVFYTIVGTGTNITVSTCATASTFDTKLFVYRGSCNTYLCVTSNDDDPNCSLDTFLSTVTFNTTLGITYRIFVTGYLTDHGPFALTATCVTPAPTVSALSPVSGPVGTVVTLTGTSFMGATAVALNGVPIAGFTVVNATTITFTIPTGATTGNVVVTTAGGSSAAGNLFTVTLPSATARAAQSQFSVWPNPIAAKGTLHIALVAPAAAASLTLRNVLGQLVSTRTFSGSTTELPTTGLAAGTYLLTVQLQGHSPSVQRVVVE